MTWIEWLLLPRRWLSRKFEDRSDLSDHMVGGHDE